MEMFCGFVRWGSYSFDCKFSPRFMVCELPKHNRYPYFQTHTEDSKEYIQQMAALRGVSAADYVIMTGGPTRLIKAFFPAQPLLIPNL